MSARRRSISWPGGALALVTVLLTPGCDSWQDPVEPQVTGTEVPSADFSHVGPTRVALCHRTGEGEYVQINVADRAVPAHLRHGDGVPGDPVPGEPGMEFAADCRPVLARQATTVTGTWNGTSSSFSGLFTVTKTGPVDATAIVSDADPAWPLRLVLLGYNPVGTNPPGTCSTLWLPTELSPGPAANPPTITAQWDAVAPGTYCLNVASAVPVPPYPAPFSWTATIMHP